MTEEIVRSAHLASGSASPAAMIKSMIQHWSLIRQLIWKDLVGRYRGSLLGFLWFLVTPFLLIVIYTFVFSVVFQSRIPMRGIAHTVESAGTSHLDFGLYLFSGLIIFGIFADVVSRAPMLIVSNPNFVKKVMFPLEILSIVTVGAAVISSIPAYFLLLLGMLVVYGTVPITALFYPLMVVLTLPLLFGIGWLFSALGVFLRDMAQVVGLLLTALTFMSPIFFPITAIPERFRGIVLMNPMTFVIEGGHQLLFEGTFPNIEGVMTYLIISVIVMILGWVFFQRTREGFADVL